MDKYAALASDAAKPGQVALGIKASHETVQCADAFELLATDAHMVGKIASDQDPSGSCLDDSNLSMQLSRDVDSLEQMLKRAEHSDREGARP